MTMIDTPQGLRFFSLLQIEGALKIQRDTGLKHSRGSILKLAQQRYGVKSGRIKGAAAEMTAMVEGAKAAQAVANGASKVYSPYTDRVLIEAFVRGAALFDLILDLPAYGKLSGLAWSGFEEIEVD